MPDIVTSLWFDTEAHEAAEFYCSLFPNSEITNVMRYTEAGPGEPGSRAASGRCWRWAAR
jgi:predicted 3-demethylubiquinone-9 3-methyltransferase (glyoxalase superfamily)